MTAPRPNAGINVTPLIDVKEAAFALNTVPVIELPDLEGRLRDILTTRADRTIFVRAGPRVRYGRVVTAMDAARSAGAERIGIIGDR